MAAKSDFPPENSEIFSISVQLGNCNHGSDHFKCNELITVRIFFYISAYKRNRQESEQLTLQQSLLHLL